MPKRDICLFWFLTSRYPACADCCWFARIRQRIIAFVFKSSRRQNNGARVRNIENRDAFEFYETQFPRSVRARRVSRVLFVLPGENVGTMYYLTFMQTRKAIVYVKRRSLWASGKSTFLNVRGLIGDDGRALCLRVRRFRTTRTADW